MALWLVFAAMTALAVLAVMVPLARVRGGARGESASVAVYRDQLQAIEADAARGLIADKEAEAARTEISRRLLAASDNSSPAATARDVSSRARLATLLGCFIIAVALGGYLLQGSPGLPGAPLAERRDRALAEQDVETLVARVEEHLQANPGDGRGWNVIAPVYLRLGRFADAARAYENAIRLAGATAERQAGFGEALTRDAGGLVTAQARDAFERAARLEPASPRARFYLALAHAQDGDTTRAVSMWRAMLNDAPADAPWRAAVEQQIAAAQQGEGEPPATALPAETQAAMIDQMVSGLAERLREDGNDLDGWLRLMRSYVVLGRDVDARAALEDARGIFAGDEQALKQIDEAAVKLGIGEAGR